MGFFGNPVQFHLFGTDKNNTKKKKKNHHRLKKEKTVNAIISLQNQA